MSESGEVKTNMNIGVLGMNYEDTDKIVQLLQSYRKDINFIKITFFPNMNKRGHVEIFKKLIQKHSLHNCLVCVDSKKLLKNDLRGIIRIRFSRMFPRISTTRKLALFYYGTDKHGIFEDSGPVFSMTHLETISTKEFYKVRLLMRIDHRFNERPYMYFLRKKIGLIKDTEYSYIDECNVCYLLSPDDDREAEIRQIRKILKNLTN